MFHILTAATSQNRAKKVTKMQQRNCKSISKIYCCICQGCIFRLTCSHPELTEDHVLTSAYVKIFRTVTRNAVNKSVWRKKDCFWLPLNKHAVNIWLSSLRIRAHLSWRTGKHLHVLHVLRTYPTCSYPGYQDTTTYAALVTTRVLVSPRFPHYSWSRPIQRHRPARKPGWVDFLCQSLVPLLFYCCLLLPQYYY